MYDEIRNLAEALKLPSHLKVPSHRELLNELRVFQKQFPESLRLTTDGNSRKGKELIFVEVGNGDSVIAVTAGAHSDEPTGIVTCLTLISNLVTNPQFKKLIQKFRFVFHPMLDPDGAELNYPWASKEFSYEDYLLNNFRNGLPSEDCEHGIPASSDQAIRPELEFFKRNIDKLKGKIKYYITLHTTHRLGGSIFVVSAKGDQTGRIETLTKICEHFEVPVIDMNLHGQDGIERIAPGFVTAPPMAKMAEKFKDKPEILAQIKMPTYEYVEHYCGAPLCLISELPYVIDEKLKDIAECDIDLIEIKKRDLSNRKARIPNLKAAVEELKQLGVTDENLWFKNASFAAEFAADAIEGEEKQLSNYEGIKAQNCDADDCEVMAIEADLKLHQLYIKCLENRADQKALLEKHTVAFDNAFGNLKPLMKIQVVPLDRQVRVQAAMIFSGLN